MEEENLITCKICGKQSTRIYGRHLKHHGITSEEYQKLYPGEPLYSVSDNKKTTVNSGKHMKEEKYKKMFSEKISGQKNPNSKSKTTEEQRKQRSPFSKSFSKYENENECIEFSKKVHENITSEQQSTRIEYWIKKGYNEEKAKEILSERQRTFTLEKCILKYGKDNGFNIWKNRQDNWSEKMIDTMIKNGNYKKDFSKPEKELVEKLVNILDLKDDEHFSCLNKQYFIYDKINKRFYTYDFVHKINKKVIEFNGDYWHCNPNNYKSDFFNKRKQMTAMEIWELDEKRINKIKENGYKVLIIWESDYIHHKEETIQKCINFLND